MPVSEMSMLRYVRILILCILMLPRWSRTSPIPSLDQPFSGGLGVMDASLQDQDDNVDIQALLGQFLYTINLTEQEPKPRPQTANVEAPEYMLELYNHYTKDHSTRPAANIVRSFKNEDSSPYSVTGKGVRTHPLTFNISIPPHEHIIAAELRLYMLVHRDPQCTEGVDWKVTIFERQVEGRPSIPHSDSGTPENALTGMQKLVVRHGTLKESRWEAFDMTDAVLHWRGLDNVSHWLELEVESENENELAEEDKSHVFISMDVERSASGKHEPVLIVFSDDKSDKSKKTIPEDNTSQLDLNKLLADEAGDSSNQENEALLMQMRSNMIYDSAPRSRRNAKGNQCKRTPLHVDFKEIGWDSWIIAPQDYEAYTCHGECNYPLLPQVTPTRHAIIRTLLYMKKNQVSQACCVPTKLEPISLLYKNDNGHVIFQHKYEGMVVAECGCR